MPNFFSSLSFLYILFLTFIDPKVCKQKIMPLFYGCSQFSYKRQFYVDNKWRSHKCRSTWITSVVALLVKQLWNTERLIDWFLVCFTSLSQLCGSYSVKWWVICKWRGSGRGIFKVVVYPACVSRDWRPTQTHAGQPKRLETWDIHNTKQKCKSLVLSVL